MCLLYVVCGQNHLTSKYKVSISWCNNVAFRYFKRRQTAEAWRFILDLVTKKFLSQSPTASRSSSFSSTQSRSLFCTATKQYSPWQTSVKWNKHTTCLHYNISSASTNTADHTWCRSYCVVVNKHWSRTLPQECLIRNVSLTGLQRQMFQFLRLHGGTHTSCIFCLSMN